MIDKVKKSFSVQAENFESESMSFSKKEYLDHTVRAIELRTEDTVLEVASGTCAMGRAMAPLVKNVTCIDATPEMLAVGRQEAQKAGLDNITFAEGLAEELPFPDHSFDVVVTRLSFHHFETMEKPFTEMDRVLKSGGKLVIIDMEAAREPLRDTEDQIETLRDISHVRNRSREEFEALYRQYGYAIIREESTKIPVRLSAWMELTKTPNGEKEQIIRRMRKETEGGDKTGFAPYFKNGELFYDQRWLLVIGRKK